MDQKTRESFRNPQDIIDSTYNKRDSKILEKDMPPYVMPLDMVKDVDALGSEAFYREEWEKALQEKRKR